MRRRVDLVLVERGIVPSRQKARELIQGRAVTCDGKTVQKPGQLARPDSDFHVDKAALRWASRGGLKLEYALEKFSLPSLSERICLDLGASTGGFTDVLLANGADHVVAIDVGRGQLHERLVADDRVTVLDNTNARYLAASMLPYMPDVIVCDASFISLQKLLPAALGLAKAGARLVALIKPQFEVGKGLVGKGGIVRDPALHQQVVTGVVRWLETDMRWHVRQTMPSPITGPDGNVEFLLLAQKPN